MNFNEDLIRSSFAKVGPIADEFTIQFYRSLFSANPGVREMFPEDLAGQRKKLAQALAVMVGRLSDPDTLGPMLQNMGERHVAYGAKSEHYPAVGAALIQAFEITLKEEFTPDVRDAWLGLYGWVSEQMITGANRALTPVS